MAVERNAGAASCLLFLREEVRVEVVLQLLVRVVDAQLLEGVHVENLKPCQR
jgi:hypothetical protein